MKGYAGTTRTVDAIGRLGLTGNIIPRSWLQWLKYDNGKPNSTAIMILSELCYWYRPVEDVDDRTGKIKGWRKKFKADKLQKSYQDLADSLGFTKRQVADNMRWLKDKGIITIEARHSPTASNVLYVDLNVDAIEKISFTVPEFKADHHTLERNPSYVETDHSHTLERETYTEITDRDYTEEELNNKHKHKQVKSATQGYADSGSLSFEEDFEQEEESLITGTVQKKDRISSSSVQSSKLSTPPPTPSPQIEVVTLPHKPQKRKLVLRENGMGWLQLPKGKSHGLANFVTVRRLSYLLAVMLENVSVSLTPTGEPFFEGNNIFLKVGAIEYREDKYFNKGCEAELSKLRDKVFASQFLTQEEFNEILRMLFESSWKWLDEKGKEANEIINKRSLYFEFYDADVRAIFQIPSIAEKCA